MILDWFISPAEQQLISMPNKEEIILLLYYLFILFMQRLRVITNHIINTADSDNKPLKGKTIVITGASRGIGLAIALKCAKDGANIAILAKTAKEHPKLPGTIYTAAGEIIIAGGKALPLQCDIRFEDQVKSGIEKVVQTFGGIDILINNASAIDWKGTIEQDMKKFDLMYHVIVRGTFMVSKYCLPHLLKAKNPHILGISIPPSHYSNAKIAQHLAYSIAKSGASLCVVGMAEQFKDKGLAVNGLWPKKTIGTAVIKNVLGGDEVMKRSRKADIMADAAYLILTKDSRTSTGKFYLDEDILRQNGITDFQQYKYVPSEKK